MIVKFGTDISVQAYIYENVTIEEGVTIFPGAVVGRLVLSSDAARKFDINSLLPLVIKSGTAIGSNGVIYTGSVIGKNSMIFDCDCIRENVVIGDKTLIAMQVAINLDSRIGKNVEIMNNTYITGYAIIEDGVFINIVGHDGKRKLYE